MHKIITAINDMIEPIGGSLTRQAGHLLLCFSREATGDSSLRQLISDLYSTGILKGDLPALAGDFLDEVCLGYPCDLARNARVRAETPDTVVFDISLLEAA